VNYTVLHEARPGSRVLTAEVLWSIPRVGAPDPSPAGDFVVVPVTTYSMETNRGTGRLWRAPTDGSEPHPLTAEARNASQPAISPDGSTLAFVARDTANEQEPGQLHILPLDGGEATRLTDMPLAVFDPRWLPDGSGIVFGSWLYTEHPDIEASRAEAERRREEPLTVYATEERLYRFWDQWLAQGTIARYFLFDVATGATFDLMPQSLLWAHWIDPIGAFDIAPDGEELSFHAFRVGGPGDRLRADVYRLPIRHAGAEPECLTASNPANSVAPRYTPDGAAILYGKTIDPDYYADRARLVRIDRATGAHDARLDNWDRDLRNWTFGPGGELWFQAEDDGSEPVWRLDANAGDPTEIVRGGICSGPKPAGDGHVYFTRHTVSAPSEVWRIPLAGETPQRVTQFTAAALEDVALGEVRDYRYQGAGGETVQAVVIMPPGTRDGSPVPLVHLIHGGPHGHFGDLWHYRWNTHAFAAPGYAVACVNFQGSTSWGTDFGRRIQGAWGLLPFEDVERATDFLVAAGVADPERMALSGGSYGGYLASWISTQTDRYACVVNHAGVFDLPLQYASDVTWGRERNMGGEIWDAPDTVDRFNPARHTAGLNTPTLVVHGERDYRVPVDQGLAAYGILKARGIPARLLYFTDENHWILKPRNSLRWYEEVLSWFARYLGGE
jgi:dipeptidyl aminopeptidase/acylaminoacyl peptidase